MNAMPSSATMQFRFLNIGLIIGGIPSDILADSEPYMEACRQVVGQPAARIHSSSGVWDVRMREHGSAADFEIHSQNGLLMEFVVVREGAGIIQYDPYFALEDAALNSVSMLQLCLARAFVEQANGRHPISRN